MDATPWLYAVDGAGAARARARSSTTRRRGQDKIPDPRRFVYVEACGDGRQRRARLRRATSGDRLDLLRPRRAADTASCATAVSAPPFRCRERHRARDVRAVRVYAFARPPADGKPPAPGAGAPDPHQQGLHARRPVRPWSVDRCSWQGAGVARRRAARHSRSDSLTRLPRARRRSLEMRGVRKAFPGVVALDGVDLTLHAGRRAHAARRERRRQVDADEDPQRRLPQGRGRDPDRRAAGRDRQPARRARPRHPRHLPGAEPRPAPLGRGEHLPRRHADALARRRRLARARTSGRRTCSPTSAWMSHARSRERRCHASGMAQRQMVEIAKALRQGSAQRVRILGDGRADLVADQPRGRRSCLR